MKVIKPTLVTDSLFVSSTIPETDQPAWSAVTTYALAALVIRDHRIYESLQASNTNHDPSTDISDPPWWLDIGPTNQWAMFDQVVNTASSADTSIEVVLTPGVINAVGLIEIQGNTVRVQMHDGATSVYDETKNVDGTIMLDWYDYFFEPYDANTEIVFKGLPQYLAGVVTVTLTGVGTVSCGGVIVGASYQLGDTEYGASAGIVDYSRKDTNAFGVTTLLERSFSKRTSTRMVIENATLRRVYALLATLRATPCLWIGADDTETFSPLVVFGFYRDFQVEIAYPNVSYCSLEIEGMI